MDMTNTELAARLRATLRDAKSYEIVECSAALLALAISRIEPSTAQIADKLIAKTRLLMARADARPDDEAIVDCYVEHFGGTGEQAIARLSDFAAQYQQEAA